MFRSDLADRFKEIFGLRKVTFDKPSDGMEQDTIFIEIEDCNINVGGSLEKAYVTGYFTIFTQNNKMPYGFINKKIETANYQVTKPLFFYEIDREMPTSPARIQNISERRTKFAFLYSEQYDPNKGEITSLVLEDAE